MQQTLVLLFAFSLANAAAFGQFGRKQEPSPTPVVSPPPSGTSSGTPEQSDDQILKSSEILKKVTVKEKPKPKYTKDARNHQVEGTVVLRCVFRYTGEVTNITVIKGLPDGLTDRAIEAAKKIKFKPAMKDGRPVSMWMQLEYNFNLN